MTDKQLRTLKLYSIGKTYPEIARLEGVTYFAIDKRFQVMRKKYKCKNNVDLVYKFRYKLFALSNV